MLRDVQDLTRTTQGAGGAGHDHRVRQAERKSPCRPSTTIGPSQSAGWGSIWAAWHTAFCKSHPARSSWCQTRTADARRQASVAGSSHHVTHEQSARCRHRRRSPVCQIQPRARPLRARQRRCSWYFGGRPVKAGHRSRGRGASLDAANLRDATRGTAPAEGAVTLRGRPGPSCVPRSEDPLRKH
jgi:hypothetical protein